MSDIICVTEDTKSKVNAAFISVYSRGVKPWANDKHLPDAARNKEVSVILMLNRWDGRIGFPGGMIDEGETPREAAIREFKEEIGYSIDFDKAEWLVSHLARDRKLCTHLYSVEVSFNEILEIQKSISQSDYFINEITGSTLVYTFNKGMRGLPFIFQNSMATTVLEELITLIHDKELMPSENLVEIVNMANVNNSCIAQIFNNDPDIINSI